jgi:hypothetical protein
VSEKARRDNKGKNRLGLISPLIVWWLGEIYTNGAAKYDARNWEKGMSYTETLDAVLRHIYKWLAGHRVDEESGLHHLAHALWGIGALLHYDMLPEKYGKFDDRPSYCQTAIPNKSGERLVCNQGAPGGSAPIRLGAEEVSRTVICRGPGGDRYVLDGGTHE